MPWFLVSNYMEKKGETVRDRDMIYKAVVQMGVVIWEQELGYHGVKDEGVGVVSSLDR